jgi:SAM-dependent methyltransferase
MPPEDDWYRHPRYYEAIFGADTGKEMDFLVQINGWFGTGGQVFLEPACGAGRLIAEGARRGHRMVGYDSSPPMLAYARRRLRGRADEVDLSLDRMERFCPRRWVGRVDLAYSLVSTFRYLDSEEAARAHLWCVHRLLRPGGIYALGFHLTDYARRRPEHERWVGRAGQQVVVCNTREWPPERRRRRARMRNRLRIRGERGDFSVQTDWYFRTWDEAEAEALWAATGFEVLAQYGFDADLSAPLAVDTLRLDRIFVLGRVGDR